MQYFIVIILQLSQLLLQHQNYHHERNAIDPSCGGGADIINYVSNDHLAMISISYHHFYVLFISYTMISFNVAIASVPCVSAAASL